jgi:hypothetical protein
MKQKAFGVQSCELPGFLNQLLINSRSLMSSLLGGIASDYQPVKYCKNKSLLRSRGLENATADQQRLTLSYSRRAFHSSLMVRENNSIPAYHFDTFKFVKRLEEEGFTLEQSEAIMSNLREVIDERYVHVHCCSTVSYRN